MAFSQKALELVSAVQEIKAEEIMLFDVNGKSSITDYFLICQGRSQGHVKGISDKVKENLLKKDIRPQGIEGYSEGSWILMDYNDVIIHIFHPETRAYYKIESLLSEDPMEKF